MNYCHKCGGWRRIFAGYLCRECYSEWEAGERHRRSPPVDGPDA